jgi:hypothetical protein
MQKKEKDDRHSLMPLLGSMMTKGQLPVRRPGFLRSHQLLGVDTSQAFTHSIFCQFSYAGQT